MRYIDWTNRMNVFLNTAKDTEFKWGEHDCCTFAADCVKAITGEDYMAEFRGKYNTEEGADEALQLYGYKGSLFKTLYKKFGKPVSGSSGKRGDVAWFDGCCGIVIGRYGIFFGQNKYVLIPISKIKFAFRVV